MTRADVLRVAKEHFLPENLTIVAVGNPKDFGKPLTALGKVTPIDLTIPEPKQESRSDGPQPTAASGSRTRTCCERAQQAMGGAEKLAAIKDRPETAEWRWTHGSRRDEVKQLIRYLAPGHSARIRSCRSEK